MVDHQQSCLVYSNDSIEVRVIQLSLTEGSSAKQRNFVRAVKPLFFNLQSLDSLKILACFQKTGSIAGQRSEESEQLKDICLDRFMQLAQKLQSSLSDQGAFYDYVDPASG